jgi:cellulose synthase (UDP-forming)
MQISSPAVRFCAAMGFFEVEDLGIVQTPQHFFNPVQCRSAWLPAMSGRTSSGSSLTSCCPARSLWGAAFCCGTCEVMRVAALQDIGGMATETVTEDTLTRYRCSSLAGEQSF